MKNQGTYESRREHFRDFCFSHSLGEPSLTQLPPPTRSGVMMLYLLSLQHGHTLEGKLIRTDCQRAYLLTAASWAVQAGLPSPVYSDSTQFPPAKAPLLPQLQRLIDNQKNWQGPKDRKEPITPAMLIQMANFVSSMLPDSDEAAMYDWSTLGISTGHR